MSRSEPATSGGDPQKTDVGSVFVSNYPPYSFWSMDQVPRALQTLAAPPRPATPLGLYLHIPFCRKRCKFCYFKVYTEKQGHEVKRYLDALAREVELHSRQPAIAGRPLKFVYVGGGTPSFISAAQLRELIARLTQAIPWDDVEEVTFECEPGTLTRRKVAAIRQIGVTRLSLGVESFDDRILEENGRAHVSKEIYRVAPWIREEGFDQLNIDLIAGMVGETEATWQDSVRRTLELDPDSVTIYQMELPFNTVYSRRLLGGDQALAVADWATKRSWQDHAIEELSRGGFEISSAYTMVKRGAPVRFVYRDSVWHGCDLLGAGVASFSHVSGVHFQNEAGWEPYLTRVESGEPPLARAFETSAAERLTRETILQLKLGRLDAGYFRDKFGVDLAERFGPALARLQSQGLLQLDNGTVRLTRQGLLRVDTLLPEFYDPRYQGSRYT